MEYTTLIQKNNSHEETAYNALLREYSGKSLKVVGRVFVTDLNDIPADWIIRHRCKDVDRSTTKIDDLLCGRLTPIQIYKPNKSSFPLTVRTMDGKSLDVIVSAKDTVGVLKLKIFQKCDDYIPDIQKLHVNRNDSDIIMFFDGMRLEMFGLNQAGTVYLEIKMKKAKEHQDLVKFKAVNADTFYSKSVDQIHSPCWSKFKAGMNFSGICSNPNCVSKELGVEREVVCRGQQFGEVRLSLETGQSSFNCPACLDGAMGANGSSENRVELEESKNFAIVPKRVVLKNARCLMLFKRRGNVGGVWRGLYRAKGKDSGNNFTEVGLDDKEIVEMTTVEPWRSPFCCVRCDTRIMYKVQEMHLGCGHVYHKWCTPSILKGLKCKVCRAETFDLENFVTFAFNY